jgi:S-(hydroxymethyl)glutathione dehydrogenase/alcohol dehydrogenase
VTRAAVLTEVGKPLEVVDIELAPTGPGQVRVRVDATGVCHSDLSLATGQLPAMAPAVLGHESVGTVIELGEGVSRVEVGQRVILNWMPSCGECFFCSAGEAHLCERAMMDAMSAPYATYNGVPLLSLMGTAGFAEESLVLERAVVPIAQDVPIEVAALVGCAVMTGVGAALNTAQVRAGSTVVVFGCGGVGLSVIQGAAYAGAARIVAVDLSAERLELAKGSGATDIVNGAEDVEAFVRDLTGGRGADYAFEAVGRSQTIRLAYQLTRRGGTTTIVGAGRADDMVEFSALELFFQSRNLQGCIYGSCDPNVDAPRMIELFRNGDLPLDKLVTDRISLEGINDAFDKMAAGEGTRSVIVF